MKIPKFNDKDFTKCIECGRTNPPFYVSKKCLHKLCYRCHGLKFEFSDEYECQLCQAENKDNYFYKLNKDDFIENPLEDFYKKDKKKRENEKFIYKRKENFKSNEEYNDYLEYVEKCLSKFDFEEFGRELEKKYPQDENEKKKNKEIKKEKIGEIDMMIIKNSPTNYNNTKICIDFDGNIKQEDVVRKEIDPITIIQETINYIKNPEKEKICGGYNINKIYEFFSVFSKGGLKN